MAAPRAPRPTRPMTILCGASWNSPRRSPEARRAVHRVVGMATENGLTAAGIFSTGAMQSALANSRGLFAAYRQTRAEFSVTMLREDSSGWAKANDPDMA